MQVFQPLIWSPVLNNVPLKVDDEYIIKLIAMTIHSNFDKPFSYYGSNPVALKVCISFASAAAEGP